VENVASIEKRCALPPCDRPAATSASEMNESRLLILLPREIRFASPIGSEKMLGCTRLPGLAETPWMAPPSSRRLVRGGLCGGSSSLSGANEGSFCNRPSADDENLELMGISGLRRPACRGGLDARLGLVTAKEVWRLIGETHTYLYCCVGAMVSNSLPFIISYQHIAILHKYVLCATVTMNIVSGNS
jgi:hypothetical protein